MEAAVEWYFALPLLFTVLAVILASVFVKLRSSAEDKGVAERAAAAKQEGEGQPRAAETQAKAAADREEGTGGGREDGEGPPRTETGEEAKGKGERVPEEDIGTEGEEDEKKEEPREGEEDAAPRTARAEAQSHPPEMKAVAAAAAAASAFVGAAVEGEEEPEDDEDDEGEEDDEESKAIAGQTSSRQDVPSYSRQSFLASLVNLHYVEDKQGRRILTSLHILPSVSVINNRLLRWLLAVPSDLFLQVETESILPSTALNDQLKRSTCCFPIELGSKDGFLCSQQGFPSPPPFRKQSMRLAEKRPT
uniref:Uncharacterized protein n=1 Tax=Sphaerodactylus townsendi TaxID=933632 RepID=A0ACB8EJX6_9SAUR